jgi:hypothetical protein
MKRAAPKPTLLIMLVGFLFLPMVACAPTPLPTRNDIVGTWTYAPKDSTYATNALDGTIEFKEDGTFQLDQIPAKVISVIRPDNLTSESGTWTIVDSALAMDEPFVDITTSGSENLPGRWGKQFLVKGTGASRQLVSMIGDRDANKNYVLSKR